MRTGLLLVVALAAGAAQAQTMYRCGNTFSQSPCGPDATTMTGGRVPQKAAAASPAAAASSASPATAAASDAKQNHWAAIARGVAEVGMTAGELQSAMGTPKERNAGQTGSGSEDQLVYKRDDRTIYVYVKNGVVSAVQEQTTAQAETAAPQRSGCLTPAQIRDLEFEDAKIANRNNYALHAQLSRARNCR